jgi:aminoglycoside 3-N-acetyltransferase
VVHALMRAVGPMGTLMMPTHTGHLSEPSHWRNPPVPAEWWDEIRLRMPAFRADETPSYFMGAIPECFRARSDARRSTHPNFSFCAWGLHRDALVETHKLEDGLGESSPLGRFYSLGGHVLLLGVGHDSNTTLHLGEYRAHWTGKHHKQSGAPVNEGGERRWVTFSDLDVDADDFAKLGADFGAQTTLEQRGRVGIGEARLMPAQPLVDFAVGWLEKHRGRTG